LGWVRSGRSSRPSESFKSTAPNVRNRIIEDRVTLASRVGHRPDVGCRRCLATLQFTRRGILRYTASRLTSVPSARSASHIHYLGGPMRSASRLILTSAVALALGACSDPQRSPTELAATRWPRVRRRATLGPRDAELQSRGRAARRRLRSGESSGSRTTPTRSSTLTPGCAAWRRTRATCSSGPWTPTWTTFAPAPAG